MQRSNLTTVLKTILLLLLIVILAAIYKYYPQIAIANGYAAKKVCTCTLATGREEAEVVKNDLYFSILGWIKNDINSKDKVVTSSIWGLSPKSAIYRPGIGCILLDGADDYHVTFPEGNSDSLTVQDVFEDQKGSTLGVDDEALKTAVNHFFDEDGLLNYYRTTAVLVVHKDTLIAERYALPFNKDTPQLGWSMTKSWMNTFTGLMVKEGLLGIQNNNLFESWKKDERKNISLQNLLQMNSGLEWEEEYAKVSDATKMLYASEDVSSIAMSKAFQFKIGEKWYYSSGTTNLISRYLRDKLGDDTAYLTYMKRNLFDVIGMHSAFIETDESGTFIGSSYGYATPRDWAKYGLLYLHDGVYNGKRLLPEGWVEFTSKAAKGSKGKYGAQFWLNQQGVQYPDAPFDMIIADGFQGQHVFVIPSHDLVIVRMGTGGDHFDVNQFLKEIVSTIPVKR